MIAEAGTLPWPESLTGSPAVAVIERAIERQRLSHSLLLTGDDHDNLLAISRTLADRLLQGGSHFPPETHPDCFALRPAGKMRQISADATRKLITLVQVSPTMAPGKVAIIHECDRMNTAAANIFLKTLEEPPAHTTLLLLTTRPYALLPTIRSRCLHFRFPSMPAAYCPDGWKAWLADYHAWLARLTGGMTDKRAVAEPIMAAYGLTARFGMILDTAAEALRKQQQSANPNAAPLSDDEATAIETGLANGLRTRLFSEIAHATRAFALPALQQGDAITRRALANAIDTLERHIALLRLNLNESAALEAFLLSSLRIWTKR